MTSSPGSPPPAIRQTKNPTANQSIFIFQSKPRSEEHTSELQSLRHLVCRLLLEKKKEDDCACMPTGRRKAQARSQLLRINSRLCLTHRRLWTLRLCNMLYYTLYD